ncbi:hypothetical protein V7P28_08415, partial [Klebsiella michiganensis]
FKVAGVVTTERSFQSATAPAGDFFLNVAPETPVTLLSGGVGQTPMLAMLDTLAKAQHPAQVNWFHAAENGDVHAFAEEVKALAGWMCDVLDNINDEAVIERVKGKVLDICARFPVYA